MVKSYIPPRVITVKTELLLLSLLWAVTLNGFATAVNARGPARVTLSYVFAIFCLSASVFHSIQFALAVEKENAAVIEAPAPIPEPAVTLPTEADTAGLHASKVAAALGASRNELTQIIDQSRRLATRLSAIDLGRVPDLSDAEYDALQGKSFGFRNEIGKLKERLTAFTPNIPEAHKPVYTHLQSAISNLGEAAQSYDRYFKAENYQEETVRKQTFQGSTREALSELKRAEAGLASP